MYPLVRHFLFRLDPERAHKLTLAMVEQWPGAARLAAGRFVPARSLGQTVCGLSFAHPLGLAAGLDKNAAALDAWFACGFSFAEVGTVTPLPQPGNPQPRLFRLIDEEALVNRMGFNNEGAAQLQRRLSKWREHPRFAGLVGVNFGKNEMTANEAAAEDYLTLVRQLGPLADYIAVNVSSPNTPGLRDLQTATRLLPLIEQVLAARDALSARPPVFVKLAPDLGDQDLAVLARELLSVGVDGLIATNTTTARSGVTSALAAETGGLSGRPLETRSTDVIRLLFRATDGKLPIIGSGGVFTAADAYRKIRAGASLVQLFTGFIYRGPGIVKDIVQELARLLEQDGIRSIPDAIGTDA